MTTHPLLKALESAPGQPAAHGEWTVEADGARVAPVGIQADRLHLRRRSPAPRDARALGEEVARRARYLLEPLEVIESDPQQAIVRSHEPEQGPDGCDYYEMRVKPQELTVERFRGKAGERRQPRPLNLTWEQAERLVRDVDAAYGAEVEEPPATR